MTQDAAGALQGDRSLGAQAERLADPRLSTVQRQSMAQSIGRVQGNRHLSRVLARQVKTAPKGPTLVQRRALGEVAERPLASISFSSPGYVATETTITAETELTPETEQPGRFTGFDQRLLGYAQAWRHRDRICAVVQDQEGKYHAIKTSFPGRGVVDSLSVVPFRLDFRRLWWVNLPRVSRGADAAAVLTSWSERAGRAMNWHRLWKDRRVPESFRCPHDGRHGGESPSLNDFRRCLEAEYAALLVQALDVARGDVHVIPSGGNANPNALVNFNLEMDDAKARGGITRLPTDRSSAIPESGITFGPLAFNSRSEIQLLGTAVHESTHLAHAELAIDWLQRWRGTRTRDSFPDWLRGQMRRRRLSREQYDLIIEETRSGDSPSTETLAHLEAFMATYHHMPIDETIYRFEQIDKGAEFWAFAGHAINDSSISRLASYYRSLNATRQHDFADHARSRQRGTVRPYRDFWNRVVSDVLS
jgi:hypothetical protein